MAARQLGCVSTISLDSLAGFDWDECRGDDLALDAQLDQLPVQRESRRAGFVANAEILAPELLKQPSNGGRLVRDDAMISHLSIAAALSNSDGNRCCVYVEAYESCSVLHDRSPFACGSAPRFKIGRASCRE